MSKQIAIGKGGKAIKITLNKHTRKALQALTFEDGTKLSEHEIDLLIWTANNPVTAKRLAGQGKTIAERKSERKTRKTKIPAT